MLSRTLAIRGEIAWVLVGQALNVLGNLLSIKVLALVIGAHGYGQLALGISVSTAVNMLMFGPLMQGIIRFESQYAEQRAMPAYLAAVRASLARGGAIFGVASAAGVAVAWLLGGAEWASLILAAAIFGLISSIVAGAQSFLTIRRRRRAVALFQSSDIWLRVLVAVAATLLCERFIGSPGGVAPLIGFALGSSIILFIQLIYLRRHEPELVRQWRDSYAPSDRLRCERQLWEYTRAFLVFAPLSFAGQFADRWVLQFSLSEADVGIFAALLQIASAPATVITTVIVQLFLPLVFSTASGLQTADRVSGAVRFVRVAVALATFACLLLVPIYVVAGELIVRILATSEFAASSHLLWILGIAAALFNVGTVVTLTGQALKDVRIYIVAYAIKAVSMVVIAPWIAPVYGTAGVCWALVAANGVFLLIAMRANGILQARTLRALAT